MVKLYRYEVMGIVGVLLLPITVPYVLCLCVYVAAQGNAGKDGAA